MSINENNIRNEIANMTGLLMSRNYNFPDYESDKRNLKKLESLIVKLEDIFTKDSGTIQELLGGEITSDDPYRMNDMGVPLYLYIDVIITAIEKNMASTVDLKPMKTELVERLNNIRNKAAKLEFDSVFDPNKHLTEETKNKIASSKGSYKFVIENIDGERYIGVNATVTSESYDLRNGDVYNIQSSRYGYSSLAFEEDVNSIEKKKSEEIDKKLEEIIPYIEHYFRGDKIPVSADNGFYASLKDPELSFDVKFRLHQLVEAVLRRSSVKILDKYFVKLKNAEKANEARMQKAKEEQQKQETSKQEVSNQDEPVQKIVEEKKTSRKKGLFSRFREKIGSRDSRQDESSSIDRFEQARREQIRDDEEVRNVVIYEKRIIDGEEVLVPLDNDEFKVVRRK